MIQNEQKTPEETQKDDKLLNANSSPTSGSGQQGQASEEEKAKQRSLSKLLDLKQYMRKDNEADVELIQKLDKHVNPPDGWEKEEHLDDFRPGYWYRKGAYVVQFYAVMGALAVVLCRAPMKDQQTAVGVGVGPSLTDQVKDKNKKQDATMIVPMIPVMEIPHKEEDDEGEEDWDKAGEKANAGFQEIIEYLEETDPNFKNGGDQASEPEKLVGGKADGVPDSNFDPKALAKGEKEETEHTKDTDEKKEIAKDHLVQDPKYYDKLEKIDAGSKDDNGSEEPKKKEEADEKKPKSKFRTAKKG